MGSDQLSEAVFGQECSAVAVGRPLQRPVQRRWGARLLLRRPHCPGSDPLDDQYRVHGRHLHDLHLHHRRHGRLCAGQEALRGPQAAVHPDRVCNGPAQAGHPDPPAA